MDALASYASHSEDSSDSEEETRISQSLVSDECVKRLPPPNLENCSKQNGSDASSTYFTTIPLPRLEPNSIFTNPFLRGENDSLAVLSKHVQLTERNTNGETEKKREKTCYKFLKGKCRFGDKCKFSHSIEEQNKQAFLSIKRRKSLHNSNKGQPVLIGDLDNLFDDEEHKQGRRKRPGLPKGLIPSKKVINMYNKANK